MSANYFKAAWSLKSHRRLKNIICAMEWKPAGYRPSALDQRDGQQPAPALPLETARVQRAFRYFDEDSDGMVTAAELAALAGASAEAVVQAAYDVAPGSEAYLAARALWMHLSQL